MRYQNMPTFIRETPSDTHQWLQYSQSPRAEMEKLNTVKDWLGCGMTRLLYTAYRFKECNLENYLLNNANAEYVYIIYDAGFHCSYI